MPKKKILIPEYRKTPTSGPRAKPKSKPAKKKMYSRGKDTGAKKYARSSPEYAGMSRQEAANAALKKRQSKKRPKRGN